MRKFPTGPAIAALSAMLAASAAVPALSQQQDYPPQQADLPAIPGSTIPFGEGGSYRLDQDDLTKQLRMVAQLVAAGPTLGMRRQVFMVSIGGFDSHANQMRDQPGLMARVANAIDYFMTSMGSLGLLNNVTLRRIGRFLLRDGFVEIGVERFACGVHFLQASIGQRIAEL